MPKTGGTIRILPFALLLGLVRATGALAQQPPAPPEHDAILSVVDGFMNAISSNDFALLSRLRIEGGTTTVERPAPSGGTLVTRRLFTPDGLKPGDYRERYWDPVVHVRGKIA